MKSEGATADEIVVFIRECLEPDFGHMMLRFSKQHLGPNDGLIIAYNSVPKGTRGVDVDNAFSNPKFSIWAAKGERWTKDGPAPAKVKIEMFSGGVHRGKSFRGESVPFRAKTASPEKVVEYLVHFFMENKDALLP
jgi:hypothetical protein